MKWNELNLEQVSIYKAIGILLIVIHNFMHWLPGPKEMEFEFEEGKFLFFIESIANEPERFFQFSMSYLGHFGVQIFIFLSAYGLTKKFLLGNPSYWQFIRKRAWSIYPSFILAILFWAVITAEYAIGRSAPLALLIENFQSILYKLVLVSNFMPDERLKLVGPWWFISLIFQVYFVFPLLFNLLKKYGSYFLIALSITTVSLMVVTNGVIGDVNLNYTIIGHMPELCLGMYLASRDKKAISIPIWIIILAVIIFLAGNVIEPLWFLNHVSILVVMIACFVALTSFIQRTHYVKAFFLFTGSISMHLFLVNGFLRTPFIYYARDDNTWLMALLYCFMSVTTSFFVAFVLAKTELVTKYSISRMVNFRKRSSG